MALVGPSGAGKSTLFELLQRFHDPSEGTLTYGDIALADFPLQDWRSKAALVPQAPILFSGDIAYNIAYGNPDASQADIEAAAKAAYAQEFIERLPQGYQSEIGAQGVQLSGGQRQRIALARAILKNPEILLLDEATSALDTESEYYVQLALGSSLKAERLLSLRTDCPPSLTRTPSRLSTQALSSTWALILSYWCAAISINALLACSSKRPRPRKRRSHRLPPRANPDR